MSDITLSTGIRQNLLSLQQTSADLTTTQEQLATGKKVNTAFDNPTSYFTSQSLTNRASDLSALLDQIGQAQQTLNAANDGLTGLTSLLEQALSTAQQAQQATKGTVTYSTAGLTGTQVIAADTTQVASTATVAAAGTASTASVQSTSDFKSGGLAQLVAGDTLTYTLNGLTVTATFGAADAAGTNTFNTAAGLIAVLNTGTGTSGNLSTVGFAVTDGAGGVNFTSNDVTHTITTTYQNGGGGTLTGANFANNTVANTQGDALTVSDGTHSSSYYYVATALVAGQAAGDAAAGVFHSAADLVSSVNNAGQNTHATITASATGAGNGFLTLASAGAVTVGGTIGANLGFGTSAVNGNFNATLSALAPGSTLSVQVGSDAADTLTFGTGTGQISTKVQLTTALNSFTDITGGFDASGHLQFTPTSTSPVTVGGTPGTATALGIGLGSTTPTATVVTPNTTRATLQGNFNALLTQIDQLAGDSFYNGVNLLTGDNLQVNFNETGTSGLTIGGVNFNAKGLGLSTVAGTGFQDNSNVAATENAINAAITTVRAQTETFGTNSSTISTRQTFETNIINTLQTGASNLVLADQNQASANLLTEQTQQQLEISALSIANEANQSVLKLFG